MEIKQINGLGVCATNCYVVISEKGNAVLIDAPEGKEEILSAIGDATLKKIILTHGHFDHVSGLSYLRKKYPNIPILIHEKELIDMKLDIPFALKVRNELKKHGINLNKSLTIEGLVDELCQ